MVAQSILNGIQRLFDGFAISNIERQWLNLHIVVLA
jgi:hypothetical protein